MIEMGKQYQTRDGRAVRILCVDGPHSTYPVVGTIEGESDIYVWTIDGLYVDAGCRVLYCDLIPVPIKHTAFMQWGLGCEPAVYLQEQEKIVPLQDFLRHLPSGTHEIRLMWES